MSSARTPNAHAPNGPPQFHPSQVARSAVEQGGVSPFAHATPPVMLIHRELFRFADIRAAAGHPRAVKRLRPQDLEGLTGAPVADVV